MNIYKIVLVCVTTLFPVFMYAQVNNAQGLLRAIGSLINTLIPIVIAAALLFFLWGLSKFISRAGDEKAVEEGKRIMIWGIVALFVMVSVWGIVAFFQEAFLGSAGLVPIEFVEPEPLPPPAFPNTPPIPPPGS